MKTAFSMHLEGRMKIEPFSRDGFVWLYIADEKEPDCRALAIHLCGTSMEDASRACEAFNAALSGKAEGYLATTAPSIEDASAS